MMGELAAVMAVQVRKIKRGASEYDYMEIMACPSGCLNGGGQIKPQPGQSSQQLLDELDAIYHDPQACVIAPLKTSVCSVQCYSILYGIVGFQNACLEVLTCPGVPCQCRPVVHASGAMSSTGAWLDCGFASILRGLTGVFRALL